MYTLPYFILFLGLDFHSTIHIIYTIYLTDKTNFMLKHHRTKQLDNTVDAQQFDRQLQRKVDQ